MVRLEFPPSYRDALASWGLAGDTLRQFYINLNDHRQSIEFLGALRPLGDNLYEYVVHVPESATKVYHFILRLDREDEVFFRVVQCDAYATDGAGKMLWSSP